MPRKPKNQNRYEIFVWSGGRWISEDEAFVRKYWKEVSVHSLIGPKSSGWIEVYRPSNLYPELWNPTRLGTEGPHFNLELAWADARRYTEAHMAKIAEVRDEIDTLAWVTGEYKSLEGEKTEILRRTIARLEEVINQLTAGMIVEN